MIEVSVILPCLNEEKAIGQCIDKIKEVFKKHNIDGEIIIVDNGSQDNSIKISREKGAKVVEQKIKGYGAAYLKGLATAQGKYIIMGDADNTYDFYDIPLFLKELRQGYDLVIGSRFKGKILKNAMPWANRYIGNPILTGLLNIFYGAKISDAHSGFRGLRREILERLNLKTTGMEFASEMIVEALRKNLRIKEIPITYYPRSGESKLKPISDAWRHIRFLLLFSPTYLFFIPGLLLFIGGIILLFLIGWEKLIIFGHKFDTHAMVFSSIIALCGYQILHLGLYAKTYSFLEGFTEQDFLLKIFYKIFSLERGILAGTIIFLTGIIIVSYITWKWILSGFGPLEEIRLSLIGMIFIVIGIQNIFSSFLLSLLTINKNNSI